MNYYPYLFIGSLTLILAVFLPPKVLALKLLFGSDKSQIPAGADAGHAIGHSGARLVFSKQAEQMLSQVNASKYLSKQENNPGMKKTASGLQYHIIKEGNGPKPKSKASFVKVHYEGRLTDGKVFDSSYKHNKPIVFKLSQVIAGWTEALLLMPAGSVWEVTIPPELAYGVQGIPGVIPPNSVLVFKIELLGIKDE
jgi:FKBP-type peptidyl-prolyl cis-trans isomerase